MNQPDKERIEDPKMDGNDELFNASNEFSFDYDKMIVSISFRDTRIFL